MFKYGMIGVMLLFLTGTTDKSSKSSFELSRESASVMISGTSTLHDWKMFLKTFDCNANFILDGSRVKGIDDVSFDCKATDLKSDNSMMDNKAYDALKYVAFPEIRFSMISAMEISPDNNKFISSLRGKLSIAGKSIPVSIPLNGSFSSVNGINIIEISGGTELKLSDFNIIPPTAIMGLIKTGDRITVSFSLQFQRKAVQ
jgi:hypothetical protein